MLFFFKCQVELNMKSKSFLTDIYISGPIYHVVKILTSSWYIFCNFFFFETFNALLKMPTSQNNTPPPGRGNHKNNIVGGHVLLVHQILTLFLTKPCPPLFFQTHFQTVAHILKDLVTVNLGPRSNIQIKT